MPVDFIDTHLEDCAYAINIPTDYGLEELPDNVYANWNLYWKINRINIMLDLDCDYVMR